MFRLAALLSLTISTIAFAEEQPAPTKPPAAPKVVVATDAPEDTLARVCESGADRRQVTVVPKDAGCEVHYVKGGKSEIAASYRNGTEGCDRVQANIAKNLVAAGYTCR